MRRLSMVMAMGLRVLVTAIGLAFLGFGIDRRVGTSFFGVLFMLFGVIVGIHAAYRLLLEIGRSDDRR